MVEDAARAHRQTRAPFYRLTPKGKKQLTVETIKWDRLAGAIARILHSQPEGT